MGFAQTLLSWRLIRSEVSTLAQAAIAPLLQQQSMAPLVADYAPHVLAMSTPSTSESSLLLFSRSARNPRNKAPRSSRTRKSATQTNTPTLDLQMSLPLDLSEGNEEVAKHIAAVEPRKASCLRVIQLQPKEQPARLVISGRMAEVCAALERLAANECASNHCS